MLPPDNNKPDLGFRESIDIPVDLFSSAKVSAFEIKDLDDVRLYSRALVIGDKSSEIKKAFLELLSDIRSPRPPKEGRHDKLTSAKYSVEASLEDFNAVEESMAICKVSGFPEIGKQAPNPAPYIPGRGLLCYCDKRRSFGLTLRKKPKDGDEKVSSPTPSLNLVDHCEYIADKRISGEYAFSQSLVVDTLYDLIESGDSGHMSPGLIVVAGGTGSGKSTVLRGLIYKFIDKNLSTKPSNRPHLLTIENPIEKFLIDRDTYKKTYVKKYEEENGKTNVDMNSSEYINWVAENCPSYLQWVQEEFQIDYTPRQINIDTPSLEQALMVDALRQTPYLVYVGEVRSKEELKCVLEFAGTGHCVITSMHAGSVLEALQRLLDTDDNKSPGAKGELAQKIRAIVHLEKLPCKLNPAIAKSGVAKPDVAKTEGIIALPSLWKGTPTAIANLVADGPSSILPGTPKMEENDDSLSEAEKECYSFSRTYFFKKFSRMVQTNHEKLLKSVDYFDALTTILLARKDSRITAQIDLWANSLTEMSVRSVHEFLTDDELMGKLGLDALQIKMNTISDDEIGKLLNERNDLVGKAGAYIQNLIEEKNGNKNCRSNDYYFAENWQGCYEGTEKYRKILQSILESDILSNLNIKKKSRG